MMYIQSDPYLDNYTGIAMLLLYNTEVYFNANSQNVIELQTSTLLLLLILSSSAWAV